MASTKSVPRRPTIADVLAKLIDRDEEHHQAWTHLTGKLQHQGSMLESVLVEQQRISRLLEGQATHNERLIRVAETQQSHSETFARAFGEIQKLRDDFNRYLEKHDSVHATASSEMKDIHASISMFKGAVRNTYLIGGAVVVLSVALLTTWRTALERDITLLRAEVLEAKTDMQALRLQIAEQRYKR